MHGPSLTGVQCGCGGGFTHFPATEPIKVDGSVGVLPVVT